MNTPTTVKTETKATLAERLGGHSRDLRLVNELFDSIAMLMLDGYAVRLKYFGYLMYVDKSPRPGRNPKTKEDCVICARRVPVMKGRIPEGVKKVNASEFHLFFAQQQCISEEKSREVYDMLIDTLLDVDQATHRIEIRGFGVFKPGKRSAYKGRNPMNGDAVDVEERTRVWFKGSRSLVIKKV